MNAYPSPGQVWRHHNGNTYTVLTVANADSIRDEYQPTVVYIGTNGKTWAKPLANWHIKMVKQ